VDEDDFCRPTQEKVLDAGGRAAAARKRGNDDAREGDGRGDVKMCDVMLKCARNA